MIIADRIRTLREQMNLSQGDIEKRTGLLRCYLSRVENGHTVPSVETLEKIASAMGIPMYQFFYDGEKPPKAPPIAARKAEDYSWGARGRDGKTLNEFRKLLKKTDERHRRLLLQMAQKMAGASRVS